MSNAPETDSDLDTLLDSDDQADERSDDQPGDESDTERSGSSGSVGSAGEGGVSDEERERIEKERAERLDPDNRPDNVEVDNTQRDFDVTTGSFEDHDLDEEEDTGPYNNPFEGGESEGS